MTERTVPLQESRWQAWIELCAKQGEIARCTSCGETLRQVAPISDALLIEAALTFVSEHSGCGQ